ncbi:hypothetical protein [Natrinema soli]|uniref:Sulfatase N-terminal domain-containing protein n=1 Tax=Natrinema soli TaxID=1930624 RepID=A0ABD5SK51_9EURY|nr:hypothetical protein [Natrinema soli]
MRYTAEEVIKGLRNPHVAFRELNRRYYSSKKSYYSEGIDILEQDWDNLIILDACRYDIFEKYADTLPGNLSVVQSRAGTTEEFLRGNFQDAGLNDTICLTTNAWYEKLRDDLNAGFHQLEYREYNTPQKLADDALELEKSHKDKRFIIHFLPPHTPYVGPTADKHLPPYEDQHGILSDFYQNDVSEETIQKAYRENIERVLPEVKRLVGSFTGKTVVTADHGELLGDRIGPIPIREWGHYKNLYVSELIKVPWLVVESDTRKDIVAEETNDRQDGRLSETVDDRLEKLGYKV